MASHYHELYECYTHTLTHTHIYIYLGCVCGSGLERAHACPVSFWHAPHGRTFLNVPCCAAACCSSSKTSCQNVFLPRRQPQTPPELRLNPPCSLQELLGPLRDTFYWSCAAGAAERAAGCGAVVRGIRTHHNAPAGGCALDHGSASLSGRGSVLQRPVQLARKVRMEQNTGDLTTSDSYRLISEQRTQCDFTYYV